MDARNLLTERPGLPDAEEPDPIEAGGLPLVEGRVGDVVERRPAAQFAPKLREPYARIDLIEGRITWHGRGSEWSINVAKTSSCSGRRPLPAAPRAADPPGCGRDRQSARG